jgi:hypothetical protein
MKKIVRGVYEITPLEGFGFNVSGPQDPIVALDDKTLSVQEAQTFSVTPDMLDGQGASHFLFLDLIFLDAENPGRYVIDMLDDQGQLVDRIPKDGPDDAGGDSAQVQLKIRVVADAALLSLAKAKAQPKLPHAKKDKP